MLEWVEQVVQLALVERLVSQEAVRLNKSWQMLEIKIVQEIIPLHVIITHSYAGGSGSGMTLPILQHIRKSFDSDTVVWVMSVGEGDSEDKDQAVYNTPFIISDVLQAHYDGIHSPVEPVLTAQWKIFKSEMNLL